MHISEENKHIKKTKSFVLLKKYIFNNTFILKVTCCSQTFLAPLWSGMCS